MTYVGCYTWDLRQHLTRFFNAGEVPEPLHPPTRTVLDLHEAFVSSGEFQAR